MYLGVFFSKKQLTELKEYEQNNPLLGMKYSPHTLTFRGIFHVKCQCDDPCSQVQIRTRETNSKLLRIFLFQLFMLKIKTELPWEIQNLTHGKDQFLSIELKLTNKVLLRGRTVKHASLRIFNKGSALIHLLKVIHAPHRGWDRMTKLWMSPSVSGWHCSKWQPPH